MEVGDYPEFTVLDRSVEKDVELDVEIAAGREHLSNALSEV